MRKDNPAFVPDSPFARPMTEEHMKFFSAIPKTELHCHLLGTTQKSTLKTWSESLERPLRKKKSTASLPAEISPLAYCVFSVRLKSIF